MIDLDLWPEAREAIQSAWIRGFAMGIFTAVAIFGMYKFLEWWI